MEHILALLNETIVALHMSCHPVKSKLMIVSTTDTEHFIINDITISYTDLHDYMLIVH